MKRQPIKRKKTNTTTKADVLFSRLVRDRDHACVRCGSPNNLQCAHIWSRRYRALRWRFANAITLCAGCHMYFTLRPAEWAEWCEEHSFCETSGLHSWDRCGKNHSCVTLNYGHLRYLALNDPPEKAADALERLRGVS